LFHFLKNDTPQELAIKLRSLVNSWIQSDDVKFVENKEKEIADLIAAELRHMTKWWQFWYVRRGHILELVRPDGAPTKNNVEDFMGYLCLGLMFNLSYIITKNQTYYFLKLIS